MGNKRRCKVDTEIDQGPSLGDGKETDRIEEEIKTLVEGKEITIEVDSRVEEEVGEETEVIRTTREDSKTMVEDRDTVEVLRTDRDTVEDLRTTATDKEMVVLRETSLREDLVMETNQKSPSIL